jgi:hypothetical protein
MFRKPRWSVTWPTRPNGVWTVFVRADDPTDAVRVATDYADLPVYALAFDYEPEVSRLLRPHRLRTHHVAGPEYGGEEAAQTFSPTPPDLREIADQVVSTIRVADAHGKPLDEVRAAIHQIVGNLLPSLAERVLVIVAAETRQINAYTSGEF